MCLTTQQEWEEKQKKLQQKAAEGWVPGEDGNEEAAASDSDEDELPFACYICRRPWEECQDPVVTRCRHYFCEHCALKHNAKNAGRCAVCELPTNGIFNIAIDIERRLKDQKRKAADP